VDAYVDENDLNLAAFALPAPDYIYDFQYTSPVGSG
jgi:hypothetical protein